MQFLETKHLTNVLKKVTLTIYTEEGIEPVHCLLLAHWQLRVACEAAPERLERPAKVCKWWQVL